MVLRPEVRIASKSASSRRFPPSSLRSTILPPEENAEHEAENLLTLCLPEDGRDRDLEPCGLHSAVELLKLADADDAVTMWS
jgi:hypothetical protein